MHISLLDGHMTWRGPFAHVRTANMHTFLFDEWKLHSLCNNITYNDNEISENKKLKIKPFRSADKNKGDLPLPWL